MGLTGQEDHAWGFALYWSLAPPWQGSAPLVHLFHPEPDRFNRKKGSDENWALFRRYDQARRSPERLAALLEEARAALTDRKEGSCLTSQS